MNTDHLKRFIVILAAVVHASSPAQTGLETDPGSKICLLVETPPPDTAALGLDKQALLNRAELRLRAAGIVRCTSGEPQIIYLKVDALPGAFALSLSFDRRVTYQYRGQPQVIYAHTWRKEYLGRNLSLIMQTLDLALDAFLVDFQSSNK